MRDNELEFYIQEKLDTGSKIWIIGDIHGYKKTLDALIKKLELKDNDLMICLGDMVDRGPESLEVLELFMRKNNYFSLKGCLLYTSPSPRDLSTSRMPSSA